MIKIILMEHRVLLQITFWFTVAGHTRPHLTHRSMVSVVLKRINNSLGQGLKTEGNQWGQCIWGKIDWKRQLGQDRKVLASLSLLHCTCWLVLAVFFVLPNPFCLAYDVWPVEHLLTLKCKKVCRFNNSPKLHLLAKKCKTSRVYYKYKDNSAFKKIKALAQSAGPWELFCKTFSFLTISSTTSHSIGFPELS
jgi:hypothetical protein